MLNLRIIRPRALLRLHTPLLSPTFKKQPRPWLRIHASGCGRVERRSVSTSTTAHHITPSAPPQPPPKSWVERTPEKIRPYLYLARVDKPIGTLLLYYPCSASLFPEASGFGIVTDEIVGSLVNNDGFLRAASPYYHAFDVSDPLRYRRVCHARSGVYD